DEGLMCAASAKRSTRMLLARQESQAPRGFVILRSRGRAISRRSGWTASTHKEMLAADKGRELACQVLRGVGDVVQRSHALHRAEGLHEIANLSSYAIGENPGPLGGR